MITRSLLTEYLPADLVECALHMDEQPVTVIAAICDELRQNLAAYAAYIPTKLVQKQLLNPEPGRISGEFWEGSIVFADLSGFTAFCEKLSVLGRQGAEEVSHVVNQLFNMLVTEVATYHGELLKFGGDALIAFFDAEVHQTNHAIAATLAALAMQRCMAFFSALKTRAGTFSLNLRVGVHSGRVFAAEVGDTTHIELIITGAEVNRVAEAQNIAHHGQVIVSAQTAALLKEAKVIPKQDGFSHVVGLRDIPLQAKRKFVFDDQRNDQDMVYFLLRQLESLRPYLVRGLPRRFLDVTISEMGEFRPVSVLFAHFSDISLLLSLGNRSPFCVATILNTYFRHVQEIVHRYEGMVNKVDMYTKGDKLMALFGAPIAHADDPLRAVQCGLELQSALQKINANITHLLDHQATTWTCTNTLLQDDASQNPAGFSFKQRIGVSSGTVFAGRVGGTQRYEYTVMGPAVNLAARLMEKAQDGMVLLSPSTRESVNSKIFVVEQEPLWVKGFSEPIVPSLALEKDFVPTPAQKNLTRVPLIAREAEMNILMKEAKVALGGAGRVVALVGDAGVGKSRLIEEFSRELVLATVGIDYSPYINIPPFQMYMMEGQSFKQSVPYLALRTSFMHILGLNTTHQRLLNSESEDEYTENLIQSSVQHLVPELSHFTPLLGDVLNVSMTETPLTKGLSAEQRHRRVQELIIALFLAIARKEPAVLLIEDVQWIDASSLDILTNLVQSIHHVPMLVLLSYRPESTIAEPWSELPTTTRLCLKELTPENSEEFLQALLRGTPPPNMLPLLQRTQGNPFFIQELIHRLIASQELRRDKHGQWELICSHDQVTIPTSIEGLIMERLDRLDEASHAIVQVASVIGYDFTFKILQSIFHNPEKLYRGLERLCEDDIIVAEEHHHELAYHFRHALLHEVTYQSISFAQRRELHRCVAQCIEAIHSGHLDEHLTLLAKHYLLAEVWEDAFTYHLAAGKQAQKRYANQEALNLFDTALEISKKMEIQAGGNRRGRIDRRDRFVDKSKKSLRDRAENLVQEGQYHPSQQINQQRSETDRRQGNEDRRKTISEHQLQLIALFECRGNIYTLMGKYDEAYRDYQNALVLDKQYSAALKEKSFVHPQKHQCDYCELTAVRLHRLLAYVEQCRAYYDSAFDWLERGMKLSCNQYCEEIARCYLLGASIYQQQGKYDQSLAWAKEGFAVAEKLDNPADQAYALLLMGCLQRDRAEFESSIASLEQARTLFDHMKDATRLSEALKHLGDTYQCVGRWQDAMKCFQRSLQMSEDIGDVMGMAQASNHLASMMVARGDFAMATELLNYSSEKFRSIGSLSGLVMTGCHHGEVLLLQQKPREALHLFLVSIASLEQIKARHFLPRVLRLAAEATLVLQDVEQSLRYISQSLAIAKELGMTIEIAIAQRVLGQIAYEQQDYALAETYLEHSHASLERLQNRYELGKTLYWQAMLAYVGEQSRQALFLLEQAEEIFKTLRAKHDLALVQECMTKYAACEIAV